MMEADGLRIIAETVDSGDIDNLMKIIRREVQDVSGHAALRIARLDHHQQ